MFDSSFTRMIHAQPNELSEDFMVVQVYYFDIIKDLIYYGFTYKGEKYIYFTSSAGQIRTKFQSTPPKRRRHNYQSYTSKQVYFNPRLRKGGDSNIL